MSLTKIPTELSSSEVTITSGNIDGTEIGGTTPAAVSATTGTFSGKIGVGGYLPSSFDVSVRGTVNQAFLATEDSTGVYKAVYGTDSAVGAGAVFGSLSNHPAIIRTNNTERLTISATGAATFSDSVDVTSDLRVLNGKLWLDDNGTHNGVINSPASLQINIDSGGGGTTEKFIVARDGTGAGDGVELFKIEETGAATFSGKLGIGVTPSTILHLKDTGAYAPVKIDNTGTLGGGSVALLQDGVQQGVVGVLGAIKGTTDIGLGHFTESGGTHQWMVNGSPTTVMTLDTSGNLGVGTSTPQGKFDVEGTLVISNSVSSYWSMDRDDSTGALTFSDTGTERMQLDASGNLSLMTDGATIKLFYTESRPFISNSGASVTIKQIDNNSANAYIDFTSWTDTSLMRLMNSGNLGIGLTPAAAFRMQVAVATNAVATGSPADSSIFAITGGSTTVGDGVTLQLSNFAGSKETAWRISSVTTSGNNGDLVFNGYAGGATYPERMRLDASGNLSVAGAATFSGNVGVGVTPSAVASYNGLTVGDNALGSYLELQGATAGHYHRIVNNNAQLLIQADAGNVASSSAIIFAVDAAEAARIDLSGNLLVGTSNAAVSAGAGLKCLSSTVAPAFRAVGSSVSAGQDCFSMYSTGAAAWRFYVDWSGTIHATSSTISAISDIRYKENIRDLDDGLAKIMALQPRKFDWKEGKGRDVKDDRGWIAQEIETVFPDLVDDWKDESPEGEEAYKSVRPDLIPVLVKAMQEQQAIIEALTARIEALEAQ
jgi:hypothetical protein